MENVSYKSLWVALSVGIAGLIMGYSFVVAQSPIDAFAQHYSCEAHS